MIHVTITRNGLQAEEWDVATGQYVPAGAPSHLLHLRCTCTIDPDVRLADIFRVVAADGPLLEFFSCYSHCDVEAFHAEAQAPVADAADLTNLEYIEIGKRLEIYDGYMEYYPRVIGIGKAWSDGRRNYGIEFTPVNELMHLPVRLNPNVEVRREGEIVMQVSVAFTLLEVLGEIYWEISFHGNPVQRDEHTRHLEETANAIQEGTAELSVLALPPKETIQ